MVYLQPINQQLMLRGHHVVVVVMRKSHMQSIAGFAGLPMPDPIRQDDVVARRVEQLARPKQHARELRRDELLARASGSVKHHDRVRNSAAGIALRRAEGRVVQPQAGQHFTGTEVKVLRDVIAFGRSRRALSCHARGAD
jgi:hypothetical protein